MTHLLEHRPTRIALVAGLTATVLAALVASEAGAVSTQRFILDDAASLSAGELVRTAVHSDGRVTVGVELRRLALPDDVPLVYSTARDADGTLYLGTGNEGRIYRVRGENVERFADTGQLAVSSLAFGQGGELWAGTLPEGRIYRISSDGTLTEVTRPDGVEHVWDLVWDAQRRTMFAATGPEGRVFAFDVAGSSRVVWDTEASHVMSLALGSDGAVYAGTSDDAIVARLSRDGRVEVVHDFPGNEITALGFADGVLAVAANEFPSPPNLTAAHSKTRTRAGSRAPRPRAGKGRIFRVDPDGRVERLYAQDEGHITDVQVLSDGTIFGGTGRDGRVIRVGPDRATSTWIDVEERQVLRISMAGSEPFFVTGDGAALYRIVDRTPTQAYWESKVLDARFRSRWGRLEWRGDGQLVLQTRSGNTETPDDTWTDWSTDQTRAGPIRSVPGRYLQIRARFDRDARAELRSVTAYFLPQNQRAVVTDVRLEGANKAATKRMRAERRDHIPDPGSAYKIAWTVENPDDDGLRYRLRYRQEGQTVWRSILREDEILTKTSHTWNTDALPDGLYVVRVEASDETANPATLALTHTRDSETLRIDNHGPRIERLSFRGGRLRGSAVDSLGPIARLELAIDGGTWTPLFPSDDLFDQAEESFEADLSQLTAGDHVVSVRATDASGNTGSGEAQVRVPANRSGR